ncbi:MAG: DegT/DnrJ/EryC1/StrS family aminotransferase, partial [Candidatus Omnitrophica bacterium]|nr:DegT/DnrJ/EryC1/StrS family aminotransferase [Candidatus Omnitrophota bacterium]
NSRLDELQAAVLRVKLRHLNRWNEARRRNARRYADAFRRCRIGGIIPRPNTVSRSDTARPNGRAIAFGDALGRGIILPREQPGCRHVYHLYAIRTRRRSRVCAALTRAGIDAQVAYPSTLPAQPALRPYVRGAGRFPIAEAVSREILALPMYPELTPSQIERVVAAVAQALADL